MSDAPLSATALEERFADILASTAIVWPGGEEGEAGGAGRRIGRSREGRPVHGYRFGNGPLRVSLLAGCHADEPVGPRLLGRFVSYLASLDPEDALLSGCEWWVIPHINPDGAVLNRSWQHAGAERYSFAEYLPGRVRELPGDDIEFGFPRGDDDEGARPEPAAAARWWREADGPFDLHLSLHGMAWAAGPWFLIDAAWIERTELLRARCAARVRELAYELHDVERHGEKGFHRIARGFATRPNSDAMRRHFLELDDPETAGRFRPSSMEHMRAIGGDPLTLVSEMPLFLLPGVGATPGPPDPALEEWRARIAEWSARPAAETDAVEREAAALGLASMPVVDQQRLQWTLIASALETVAAVAANPRG